MSGWTWALLVMAVWGVIACLVSLIIGRVVRTRDVPEARHVRELQTASPTPLRPVRVQAHAHLIDDRPATFA